MKAGLATQSGPLSSKRRCIPHVSNAAHHDLGRRQGIQTECSECCSTHPRGLWPGDLRRGDLPCIPGCWLPAFPALASSAPPAAGSSSVPCDGRGRKKVNKRLRTQCHSRSCQGRSNCRSQSYAHLAGWTGRGSAGNLHTLLRVIERDAGPTSAILPFRLHLRLKNRPAADAKRKLQRGFFLGLSRRDLVGLRLSQIRHHRQPNGPFASFQKHSESRS